MEFQRLLLVPCFHYGPQSVFITSHKHLFTPDSILTTEQQQQNPLNPIKE